MDHLQRPATELVADLASGDVKATDVMDATLARIESVNGSVNAIVALRDRDSLLAEAAAKDAGGATGPLHGLPIAVKDLAETEGIVTTFGSPLFADHVPAKDEIVVRRLRAAGAIVIGKTNTPEWGLGSNTFNPVYGATCNPYDATKVCGGSSGGAAVALATGMLTLADGSDMMGSLRNPAAWNNVFGFRPSWGLVPSEPKGETFLHQLATLGPMARNPGDLGLLLDVMSGPDGRQPHNVMQTPVHPVKPAPMSGLRIGWLGNWGGAYPMEPGILALCAEALSVFEAAGAVVEPVAPPFAAEDIWSSWTDLRSWQVGMGLAPLMADQSRKARLKDSAIWEAERGAKLTGAEIHAASAKRTAWFQAAHACFETFDALVLPSAQVWPFDVGLEYPTEIAGVAMDTYHRWMEVTIPIGLLGLPAVALPAGFGAQGLPMGIQMFGPRGADSNLLRIAAAYHDRTRWPEQRPPAL